MPAERREAASLIVLGGSVGGLVAALTMADHAQRAVILEAAKEAGGGAGTRGETIAAAGTRWQEAAGVQDTPDALVADVVAAAHHHVDEAVVRAVAVEAADTLGWLADRHGVDVEHVPGARPPGHSAARLHFFGPSGGASLVPALVRSAHRRARVAIRPGSAVERLVVGDGGDVTGVALRPDRRGQTIISGAVLLACGGFSGNVALVAEHAPAFAGLPHLGSAGATGTALQLGLAAGARTAGLATCAVSALVALPGHLAVSPAVVRAGGILVNQAGRRFHDETGDAVALAEAVHRQPGRVAYLVFDERVAAEVREGDPFLARIVLPRTIRRSGALADLGKQFEIPPEALEATLDAYNANLELGGEPFGREAGGTRLEPPYLAIRVTAGRQATLGGLAVDAHARVLGASGEPIAGLYAAGGAAVSLVGDDPRGGLVGLDTLAAIGLGRLAARHVATRATDDEPANVAAPA